MRYMKRFKSEDEWFEVSRKDALNAILGTYKDSLEVRSMLSIPNYIPCVFSEIRVFDDCGNTVREGEMCLIPEEILAQAE